MFSLVLKVLYLGLPAIIANSLPIFFSKYKLLEFFNKPVDFNYKLLNQPLFGRTKTWRGFLIGIIGGIIVIYIQRYFDKLSLFFKEISIFDYQKENILLIGFLLSFGALFGDLIKSFIKRRLQLAPGVRWWPWDLLDATIGSLIFISLVIKLDWSIIITSLIIGPLIHLIANFIGYQLKWKYVWW